MLFRRRALPLVKEWVGVLESDPTVWDQTVFNRLAREQLKPEAGSSEHYISIYRGTLRMGILPISLFASGHSFFIQRIAERRGLGLPYVVHATFQYSGTPGAFVLSFVRNEGGREGGREGEGPGGAGERSLRPHLTWPTASDAHRFCRAATIAPCHLAAPLAFSPSFPPSHLCAQARSTACGRL